MSAPADRQHGHSGHESLMPVSTARRFGFSKCFACGPDNPRGLGLAFRRQGDHVVCTYTPALELGGYGTILHGGVTSTLLDEALVWAVYGALDRLSMTLELNVRFLAPIRCGAPLTLTGRLLSKDRRHAMAHAEIHDDAGTLCASAEGRLRFLSTDAAVRLASSE